MSDVAIGALGLALALWVAFPVMLLAGSVIHENKVRDAVVETIFGSISVGRAGKTVRGELEGLHSAHRGEFRVIYEIDEASHVVLIHRAQASKTRVQAAMNTKNR